MSDPATIRRQLKIKTGVVNRILKEHKHYEVEAQLQKTKLDKLIADSAEEWDIKNARKILEESEKMNKDVDGRKDKAVEELKDLLEKVRVDSEIAAGDEFIAADEVLKTASA